MTASRPCCYVHIGAPKTGSTSLQKFFFDNRQFLYRQGLLYPEVNLRGYGHHDLAFLLAGGYPDWAIAQARPLGALADELRQAAADFTGNVLLSSENFYLFPSPAALRDLLEQTGVSAGRRVVIIVYLRRQDDAHESWYNQTVKTQGATYELAECVERWQGLWDYRARLAEWAGVYGESHILVRPYEEGQFRGGSLIGDFLAATGVSPAGLAMPTERMNTGLNRDVLEFQRLVNRLPLEVLEKRRFFRELTELTARCAGTGLFDETPLLDDAQRRNILQAYHVGNVAVAQSYLQRDALFLDAAQPRGSISTAASGLAPEKLACILGWLMARGWQAPG